MRLIFYYSFLFAVVAIAFWRGRREERVAAVTCLVGTLVTALGAGAMSHRFADFNSLLFLADLGVFVSFLAIALRTERFWPIWVAGLQLTATSVHLLKLINPDLMRFVFGAALAFWSYPILALIAVGAFRTRLVEGWRRDLIA
ncbi:hypothetical protein GCM10022281_13340 [Sphingomonas rosea]|jgi:hypothetical protein|uniref:Uncharacterized protein n=1 Tax=Sphingomonas rosea TaxID=335605 RepID=A0ABP7U293_9SPHN